MFLVLFRVCGLYSVGCKGRGRSELKGHFIKTISIMKIWLLLVISILRVLIGRDGQHLEMIKIAMSCF